MKNQVRKLLFIAIVAFMVSIVSVGFMTAAADSGHDSHHDKNSFASVNSSQCNGDGVYNDILDGSTGQYYNLEEEYWAGLGSIPIMPLALDGRNNCNDNCSTCGPGRVSGGTNLLSAGCRNYKGWSYSNYGATDIPFWLNMTSLNTITNTTHRDQLINDLRDQAAMWNQAVMHGGVGQIVNLYEVGVGSNTRPANINGRRVVEFLRLDGSYAGQFSSSEMQVRINYTTTGIYQGRNVDTPVHEMGHLLGLMDLDAHLPETDWPTHLTLMGYSRGTTRSNVGQAIKYQDIQGIAVMNGRHTCSNANFMRYITSGNNRLHICFYCDRIDSRTSVISGSQAMADSVTCVHEYQQMVSHGERHWLKCTKCYKVVESEFKIKGLTSTTLEVTGLINTNKTSVTIPSSIGGQAVTSIGSSAFSGNTTMSQISIPASITTIGESAFKGCWNLEKVLFYSGSKLTTIADYAFANSGLEKIAVPPTVQEIGSYAFAGCWV